MAHNFKSNFTFDQQRDYRHRTVAARPLVIIESPYAGNVDRNIAYACAAMRDSLLKGEYPLASHLLYTQTGILNDDLPDERQLGIDAGLAWGIFADLTTVYVDLGVSTGMQFGIDNANRCGRPVIYRNLEGWS